MASEDLECSDMNYYIDSVIVLFWISTAPVLIMKNTLENLQDIFGQKKVVFGTT